MYNLGRFNKETSIGEKVHEKRSQKSEVRRWSTTTFMLRDGRAAIAVLHSRTSSKYRKDKRKAGGIGNLSGKFGIENLRGKKRMWAKNVPGTFNLSVV